MREGGNTLAKLVAKKSVTGYFLSQCFVLMVFLHLATSCRVHSLNYILKLISYAVRKETLVCMVAGAMPCVLRQRDGEHKNCSIADLSLCTVLQWLELCLMHCSANALSQSPDLLQGV